MYRLVYEVMDDRKVIVVISVEHRYEMHAYIKAGTYKRCVRISEVNQPQTRG
jgi:hypothetical protein